MRRTVSLLVSLLAVPAVGCSDPPTPEKATDLDKIQPKDGEATALGPIPSGPIAKVGGVEIPNAKFTEIYELKIKKYSDRGREIPASADRRYRKSIAERLIYHEVLAQQAKKLGIEYDASELEEREAQQKRGIRDWEKHLSRRGETERSLRDMYEAELREKAILEKLGKLEVTPDEVEGDYQKIKGNWKSDKPRVRASHVLIPVGPEVAQRKADTKASEPSEEEKAKWDAEAKAKADEVYKLATAAGADFAALAREHSTGPSAAKGGDIGIFTADRMAEEFSAVAFKLSPDAISKPVKTKFGYHIIKVTGKWPAGELPKDALEDQIQSRLKQRKLHQGRRELKDELLEQVEIVDNIAPTLGPEPERKKPKKLGGAAGAERRRGLAPHGKPGAAALRSDRAHGERNAEADPDANKAAKAEPDEG